MSNIPPRLPPRNPSGDSSYDSIRNISRAPNANRNSVPLSSSWTPSKTVGEPPFKPLVPKGLIKSPSHDSNYSPPHRSPTRPYSGNIKPGTDPPPLPRKPKPVSINNRPPAPLPIRASTFTEVDSPYHKKPRIAADRRTNSQRDDNDSDSDISYEDVSFAPPDDGDGLPLLGFVEQKQGDFPMAFEVILGYSSLSEDISISEGEKFIAHFLKRAKMFMIQTENNEQYKIPLNTSFQFALLHNPNNNTKEAMAGFIFKTAGDIMLSKTLPKIIRAKRPCRGAGPESSVSNNELLFVKEVVSNAGQRKFVKCIQVEGANKKEKYLYDDCHGEFTTAPHEVRVNLPEIVKHFQLPLLTLMCMGPDNEEDIPSNLISTIVTITNAYTEESLIASSVMDDHNDTTFPVPEDLESVVLNDIPLNFDISVNPYPVSPTTAEGILKLTVKLHTDFTPVTVFPYLANYSRSQICLIKSVQKEDSMIGITLVEPQAVSEAHRVAATVLADETLQNSGAIGEHIKQLELQSTEFQKALENISGRSLSAIINGGGKDNISLTKLQSECVQLRKEVAELKGVVMKLSSSVNLANAGGTNSETKQLPAVDKNMEREKNRRFLNSLQTDEICEALLGMNLGEHVPKFKAEMVTGSLLLELTEEILQNDLGLVRGIQRMRIMKLISGEYSAEQYLLPSNDDDSYIKMTKQ